MADGSPNEGDESDDGDGEQADQASSRSDDKEEDGTEHKDEQVTTPELTGVERIDYEVSFEEGEDTAMEMLGREEDWEPNPFASAGGPW